ncbi:hypothetical protein K438DRAFT_1935042 [Mycena galopus ATCC 62051]|nr:hypothetical protein K438DRAFT_1935042 [Mycena galopus ATCC 62051]
MPFTGNVTAWVGRETHRMPGAPGGDLLIFWNYYFRKLVVIEAMGLREENEPDYGTHKSTFAYLEHIQSLIDTIDFEHGEIWAYMIDLASGRRIIQKPVQRYCSPCDFLWAPRVELSEIEITSLWYMSHGYGRGVWRGKEVDIQIACNDTTLKLIERETRAARALRGMDLAYEIVAHIFVGDLLFGFLTESAHLARPVRVTDRAAVYAAFAKLERGFMLHNFLIDLHRMVMDASGRVRILNLHHIRYYSPDQQRQFEEDAQFFHWDRLRKIFDMLAECQPVAPAQFFQPAATILAKTPSPERLLIITIRFDPSLQAYLTPNEIANRRRKSSSKTTRKNSKGFNLGISPPGPKQGPKSHDLVLGSKTSRNIESDAPPPYTKYPSRGPIGIRIQMLAPERQAPFDSCSIVELE